MQRSTFTLRDIQDSLSYFDGISQPEIENWIEEFEENAKIVNWDEVQKYIYAKQLIKGAARIFVRSQPSIASWQELKDILIQEFGNKYTAIDIHKQLQKRRKYYNESCLEYLYTIMEIGSKVKLDERSIIDYFIEGINDTQQNKIVLYEAKTTSELKQKILIYEKIKSQYKKYDNIQNTGHDNSRYRKYEYTRNEHKKHWHDPNMKKQIQNNKKCSMCPHLRNHTSEECWKNMCYKCKQRGHRSFECTIKENNADHKQLKQTKNTNETKNEKESRAFPIAQDFNKDYVLKMNENSFANVKIPVSINGIRFVAIFDTGSELSLLKKSMFDKLGYATLFPDKIRINGVGQGQLVTLGYTIFKTKIKNVELNMTFHIVEDDDLIETSLIGNDVLSKVNVYITEAGPTFILKEKQEPLEEVLFSHMLGPTQTHESSFIAGQVFNAICNDLSINLEEGIEIGHLDQEIKITLFDLLSNYKPNKTKNTGVEMKVVVKDDIPIYHRPRRFPINEQKIIDKQIEEWLEAGIVKPSTSEYASQILLVNKKNGSKRLCCDYRKINAKIVRDNFPMIRDETIQVNTSMYSILLLQT